MQRLGLHGPADWTPTPDVTSERLTGKWSLGLIALQPSYAWLCIQCYKDAFIDITSRITDQIDLLSLSEYLLAANIKSKMSGLECIPYELQQGKEPEEMMIAVMGPTGTGKSSFINLVSGANLQVGGGLQSCTTSVQATKPFDLDGFRVTLIDTPGFDDSTVRDTDVLAMIAAYLSFTYKHGKMLAGVIYMHRILDNRMGGISSRNFRMFRNLCGDKSLKNVVIATNMWGEVDFQVGQAREKELASKDIFFKSVLDKGARLVRHDHTLHSARTILRSFVGQRPQALQIQHELDEGMDISQTSAGKELNRDLTEQIAQHRKEMQVLMDEMNETSRLRDEETRRELADDRAKLQEEVKRIQADARNMAAGYAEALERLEQRMKETEIASSRVSKEVSDVRDLRAQSEDQFRNLKNAIPDNAVLEAKLGGAFPIFGFWGKLAVMLSPFSLSWK
ncbi:hypothetical protein D9615_007813 [Tricholomella constricta]|uniref:G domain-containing protein n=1 Tax=Tricholomella constricta TaxID=117010 RepID=A0A8H5H4P3_9AGAR|nr:hypothetical protein D9615_007813 [Tricholomella constricta]